MLLNPVPVFRQTWETGVPFALRPVKRMSSRPSLSKSPQATELSETPGRPALMLLNPVPVFRQTARVAGRDRNDYCLAESGRNFAQRLLVLGSETVRPGIV